MLLQFISFSFSDLELARYSAQKPQKRTFKSVATRTRYDRRCDVIGLIYPFRSQWMLVRDVQRNRAKQDKSMKLGESTWIVTLKMIGYNIQLINYHLS